MTQIPSAKEGYSKAIVQSFAGWYIATIYTHPEGIHEVCSRESDYFTTAAQAETHLKESRS